MTIGMPACSMLALTADVDRSAQYSAMLNAANPKNPIAER